MIAAIKQQVKDFKLEVIDRVDWPKPEKVRSATYAVVVVSIFMAAYLFLWDQAWTRLISLVLPKH